MKKILLLFAVFLFTGCSTQYNLTINSDKITEDISITIPKNVAPSNVYANEVNNPRLVYPMGTDYYNMKTDEDGQNYYVNYSYDHIIDNYNTSVFIKKCYDSATISNSENEITIQTGDRFNCISMEDGYYMDNVTVNIKTDLRVTSNNADTVSGNTYTWVFNKDNYLNKPINIEISKLDKGQSIIKDITNEAKGALNGGLIIFIMILSLLMVVIYIFVRMKHKKTNNF